MQDFAKNEPVSANGNIAIAVNETLIQAEALYRAALDVPQRPRRASRNVFVLPDDSKIDFNSEFDQVSATPLEDEGSSQRTFSPLFLLTVSNS